MPQTYTASSRTLSGITDVVFTSASVGKIELFYDANGSAYFAAVASFVSASSAVLDASAYLPAVDTTIFGVTEVEPDVSTSAQTVTANIDISGLKNFITDNDLKIYAPNIAKFLWSTQTTYSIQIAEAFRIVLADLRARGIETRKLGNDIMLNETTVDGANGFNRFTVRGYCTTGTAYVTLQGSRDGATWESITVITLDTTNKTQTDKFDAEYAQYRVTVVGDECTYTARLSETYHDALIVLRALEMIYFDFAKEPGDVWMARSASAAEKYAVEIQSVNALIDSNDSGTVDAEDEAQTTQVMFCR